MDYSGRPPVIPKPMPTFLFDAITITIFSFAALTTAIRFYLWIFVLRAGKLDSYLILIGTVSYIITKWRMLITILRVTPYYSWAHWASPLYLITRYWK